jgi:flagellar FliL protein
VGVVGLLVILASTVVGTLFLTGFFNPKPVDPEHAEAAADAHGGKGAGGKDAKDSKPGKKTKDSPELVRFEYTYMQIEREFLVNLSGSKKVMSVQIAVMTHYDDRVFENVKKHEFALRSVIMDVMRQTQEADMVKPDFRKELAAKIRDAINTLLEKYEDFGGVEDIYFTNFIVQ